MIKSMTAFGRGEYALGGARYTAEIRSVNHRYRDIILRIPRNFQVLDQELKSIISSKIMRGRVEASLQMEKGGKESPYSIELNEPLVNSYLEVFRQLKEQFGLDQDIRSETFCQLKDVIIVKPEEIDIEEARPGFHEVLKQTLDSLEVMRITEGEAIEADFLKRIGLLEEYLDEVRRRSPHLVEEHRKRLEKNINSMLADLEIDEGRLAQEVALFAQKSDITEEIVRIRSHVKQFREYLSIDEAQGRRLDFLIQEINREVNTLSVKSSDSLISKIVVEMKAELEKLREQVQNVE